MMDRLIQAIALVVLMGITAALISTIKGGSFPYITDKDDYAYNYAYTEESVE